MRDLRDEARQYAFKLLSYRGRSEKELEGRLIKKGFPESIVFSTINRLKQSGLINDRALSEDLKREAITRKLLSYTGAKRFMRNRGIPQEIVDSMFSHDENEDIENAKKLVDKKLRAMENCPAEKIKRRLYNLLLRRGYSFETIKTVLKDKNFNEED
ncbi:MAG: RecX family transcriptional regulator [Nitrospirota bacterium]